MLKIKVGTKSYTIEMKGHSGYAEPGKDIVCAAASILCYTLAETLTENVAMLRKEPEVQINDNEKDVYVKISCEPHTRYKANIQTILVTIVNGFGLLADGYPDNVQLNIE